MLFKKEMMLGVSMFKDVVRQIFSKMLALQHNLRSQPCHSIYNQMAFDFVEPNKY